MGTCCCEYAGDREKKKKVFISIQGKKTRPIHLFGWFSPLTHSDKHKLKLNQLSLLYPLGYFLSDRLHCNMKQEEDEDTERVWEKVDGELEFEMVKE